ncbi:unnamed protein product [Brassica rapa]|uniref:TF-B3 domain-containing protein n=1 Tax=Brassica campestris TaxID=3711 RepID=A0A3P6AQA6_BRACM|nr:unnamed protein product [Brassica rapa]VDC86288.1 unnamed protein product [Brassica rapa]
MKPGFSFLLLPLFLILPLQEIDVFWFPFFVTVTPAEDCVPKFFRVYMPGISGDDLELPVCFNSFLPKPLPKHVTVKSIYGKTWRMALRRCGGDAERYMLLNGWKRIAKDESLTTGNVLEFQLDDDGSMCFNFSIYEPLTMCKRLRTTTSVQETEDADDVLVLSDDDDDDDFQDSDYSCADDNDASAEDDDHGVAAGDDHVALDGSDDDEDAEANHDDDRRYLDDRSNAFFRVKINPKKISQLRIPSKVINDYGLSFSEAESINIIDPLVKKFGKLTKKIKVQTNGSVFIKGYGAIYRRNGVRSTDKMICELKKAGNNNVVHTIKFHVIK